MWPWGHLAIGYLVYSVWYRIRLGKPPRALPVVLLALGTQFPDIVDKPLAYWFAILPEGRSLAHSYLFVIPLCLIVYVVLTRYGLAEGGVAFTIGYFTHPIADGLNAIVSGQWTDITFMVWPLLPIPDYEASNFVYHLQDLLTSIRGLSLQSLLHPISEHFVLEIWLTFFLVILWIVDGLPPVKHIVSRVFPVEERHGV